MTGGMPDFRAIKGTAVLTNQLCRENAFAAVSFAQRLPAAQWQVAVFHIILENVSLVDLHFLFQKIYRELLLQQGVSGVLFIGKEIAATLRSPSASQERDVSNGVFWILTLEQRFVMI